MRTRTTSEKQGPAPAAPGRRDGPATIGVLALLTACTFLVYGNALPNPFLLDDPILIVNDPRVQSFDLAAIATQQYWPGERGNLVYRPLTLASLAINWWVAHEPWTFRLVNLLLHAAAAFALHRLARQLAGSATASTVAALLFVVHPIHTTPLNQIVDRADIAAAACVLLAALVYARDVATPWSRWSWRPLLGGALFGAALLCKESALAFVGWVALLEIIAARRPPVGGRLRWRRVLAWSLSLGVILVAYAALRWAALGAVARPARLISPLDNIIARPEYGLAPDQSVLVARWGTPLAVLALAVRLLVWPWPLSWDYSYAAIESVRTVWSPRLWAGVAIMAAIIGGAILSYRSSTRSPPPPQGRREARPDLHRGSGTLAWAGLTLFLTSYAVVSNTFLVIGAAFAERYLYLPSAGFCLLVGGMVDAVRRRLLAPKGWRRARAYGWTALTIAVVLLLGSLTTTRNLDFRSLARLNAADVRTQPRSARLWAACASDSLNAGDYATAILRAEKAIDIFPEDPKAWRIAGLAHRGQGRLDAALQRLERSFELGGDDNENAVVAAADILRSRGDFATAVNLLARFVTHHDDALTACNNLAWYLVTAEPATLRDPQRALEYARRAREGDPTSGDFLDTYLTVLEQLGRADEARETLRAHLPRIPANDPQRSGLERKLRAMP